MGTTLRRAHSADLPALAALRAEAFGTDEAEARGWMQHIAGLDNVLVLERGGEPLALLGAVPVDCGRRRGVWFSGMLTRPEARGHGVMKNLMSVCLRAYAQSGYDFAVTAPGASRASRALEGVGFQSAFPLRVVRRPVQRSIWRRLRLMRSPCAACWTPACTISPPVSSCPNPPWRRWSRGCTAAA